MPPVRVKICLTVLPAPRSIVIAPLARTAIYLEASVGKACFKEMGIEQWTKVQPDFPPELLGIILSTYFGVSTTE